ncbi:hypothetical protein ACFVXH_06940 [Kitasatospora sp. NPDC058184]|uniref:hypothetical protein n=1 Tax=Kitasatospora sp. NPDC058184 TaxID=3346370 RepID=UPI0036DD1320
MRHQRRIGEPAFHCPRRKKPLAGLLEEREPAARERVEGLREAADRVLAELAEAETARTGR